MRPGLKSLRAGYLFLFINGAAFAQTPENLAVLPSQIIVPHQAGKIDKSQMMQHYLLSEVERRCEKWKNSYEWLKTPEQIREYQNRLRKHFLESIGGLPERTPLNSRLTGVIRRKDYRVEKIFFESQPNHRVTALLFLPDSSRYAPPYPGVLIVCGHYATGKAAYLLPAASMAVEGMAALLIDPIDQGERLQIDDDAGQKPLGPTQRHNMSGIGSILLGQNTARFEIWDGMRAIDYLLSRPDIRGDRIGCAGNSGGGTQTAYLMALDERIRAAAPNCYLTSFERLLATIGPQDAEQNIFGQLEFGMDQADYVIMRAPKPTLISCATLDFFDIRGTWDTYRHAKRLYSRMGFSERVDLEENDGEHGWALPMVEATVRWMKRWLQDKDEPVVVSNLELPAEKEIQCAPGGQIRLLQGERTVYDLNRGCEKGLSEQRKATRAKTDRAQWLEQIRKTAGIRPLHELPGPKVRLSDAVLKSGYTIRKMVFEPEPGIVLPALLYVPDKPGTTNWVMYADERGKNPSDGLVEKWVQSGRTVLAVDLRGTGETMQTKASLNGPFGDDAKDVFLAYLLGRSYVGMRAEDILVCATYLQRQCGRPVDLIAVGQAGIPALHAAVLGQELFGKVKLVHPLVSWSDIVQSGRSVNQLAGIVHGALKVYDLPDLVAAFGRGRIDIEEPLDAMGRPAVPLKTQSGS